MFLAEKIAKGQRRMSRILIRMQPPEATTALKYFLFITHRGDTVRSEISQ
jgi:hypothetical protein